MIRRLAGLIEAHIVASYVVVGPIAIFLLLGSLVTRFDPVWILLMIGAAIFAPLVLPPMVMGSWGAHDETQLVLYPVLSLYALASVVTLVERWGRWKFRYPAGHCRSCGYNLTANTTGVCPECGTTIAPPPPACP